MKPETEVLIVGAGPTGLVLALWLTRLGVKVRIIDKAAESGTTSRALAVHARILEFYDQIDIAREIVDRGLKMGAVTLWVAGKERGRIVFGDMGQGVSPFPYALIFPQDEHERLLIDRLKTLGVAVERPVELVDIDDKDAGVVARLRRPDGSEEAAATAFAAGCDGAHSIVREAVKVGFPGGTYSHIFYVEAPDLCHRSAASDRDKPARSPRPRRHDLRGASPPSAGTARYSRLPSCWPRAGSSPRPEKQ
jgi:2-polyprenyl-6-methoxyphenol hydroxylase-like FAD-dependent oxidoreductase